MADSAAETQAPSIEPKKVLHYGDTTATRPGMTPEERQWLSDIGKLKEKGATGKEQLSAVRERTSSHGFSDGQRRNMELSFGGGKAKEDQAGNLTIDQTANTQEKASYENARALIAELSGYIDYVDILNTNAQTGRPIDSIIRDRNNAGFRNINTRTAYDNARQKALDAITNSEAMRDLFPDVQSIGSANVRRDFIEKVLANDTTLRNSVVRRLNEISERASALPSIEKDAETETATREKTAKEQKLTAEMNKVFQELQSDVTTLSQTEITRYQNEIRNGKSVDHILSQIRQDAIWTIPNAQSFSDYYKLKGQQDQLNRQLLQMTNKNNQQAVQRLTADINTLDQQLTPLETIVNNPANQADLNQYNERTKRYATTNPDGSQTAFASRIGDLTKLQSEVEELEATISLRQNDNAKKEADSRRNRLAKETEIINELRGVFSESILDTLEKRYDEVAKLEQQRLEKAEKDGISADDKAIEQAMRDNWIQYDIATRSKTVHVDQIQEDIRTLAYKGEDGLRRLILSDMNLQIPMLDNAGNVIPNRFEDLSDRNTLENIDLDRLSDEQKKRLDEAYNKHADNYRQKLMKDFFASKGLKDRLKGWVPGTDKLGLNKDEWRMLEENFKGKLAEGLGQSTVADGVVKNLEAAGIKPDSKMKWLIYMLVAILGVGAVATLGAGAVAVSAAGIAKAT